jgi:hypothetical protein
VSHQRQAWFGSLMSPKSSCVEGLVSNSVVFKGGT